MASMTGVAKKATRIRYTPTVESTLDTIQISRERSAMMPPVV